MSVPISTKSFIWGRGTAREEVSRGSFLNVYSIRIILPVAVMMLLTVVPGTPTMRIIIFFKQEIQGRAVSWLINLAAQQGSGLFISGTVWLLGFRVTCRFSMYNVLSAGGLSIRSLYKSEETFLKAPNLLPSCLLCQNSSTPCPLLNQSLPREWD